MKNKCKGYYLHYSVGFFVCIHVRICAAFGRLTDGAKDLFQKFCGVVFSLLMLKKRKITCTFSLRAKEQMRSFL